jgi:hypothetical protein
MMTMCLLVGLLADVLILPGWIWVRRRQPWSRWIFALPFMGVALWFAIVALGLGAQSFANIVEALIVAASAVVTSYLVFLLAALSHFTVSRSTFMAFIVVTLVVVCLRVLMPNLPE